MTEQVTDAALDAERAEAAATIATLQAELAALQAPKGAKIGVCPPLNNLYGNTPQAVRIFISGGNQPTNVDLTGVPDTAMIILSRKDRGPWFNTTVDNLVKNHPNGKVVVCAGIHEPENDNMSVATYQGWVVEDAAMLKARGVTSCQILMGGTCNAGTWEQWMVPDADWVGWDVYHGGAGRVPKTYRPPATWLKPYFDANTKIGKPILFPEFGSRPTAADTNGTGLVQWMKDNSAYCRASTAKTACWFNAGAARIRFQNQAQADAWLT